MITETIKYVDNEGNPVEETHCFHLSKLDLVKLQIKYKEGLEETIKRIVEAEDGPSVLREFEFMIRQSHRRRDPETGEALQDPAFTERFMQGEAYSEFVVGLLTDEKKAANFTNGVLPAELRDQVQQKAKKRAAKKPAAQA